MRKPSTVRIFGIALAALPILVAAKADLPKSKSIPIGEVEPVCQNLNPEWRQAQVIEGVAIQESLLCNPDQPEDIALTVKGTNNISMDTLMKTFFAADAITKTDDVDGDGDPDKIVIRLEATELNGHSPDFNGLVPTFDIAPGIQPGMWVFAPKSRGMATNSFVGLDANPLLRAPSPVIRVEQGDTVWIVLENTHYFPHTIHLHGVDHPFLDSAGNGNDGVPQTSEKVVMPGENRVYEINPRVPGTFVYHCHVQTHTHLAMGLVGMLIVEENRPNNWVQTFNVGAGHVRHPSKAVLEKYDQEYDLHYHAMDKELHSVIQQFNDPRLIAKKLNRDYDLTDATEDYHTLNGRSFPYTLRESLIVTEPDQNIKIRMFNSSGETVAIHTHGHKAAITHKDGIAPFVNLDGKHLPVVEMRDIYDLAPAQRADLRINTTDDGLHNYGQGIWIFHDHREKGITTDGMNPGGNVSAIVYKSFINEMGIPKVQGMDLQPLFTKAFFERKVPVWQDIDAWNSLGEVDAAGYVAPLAATPMVVEGPITSLAEFGVEQPSPWSNLIYGILFGVLGYIVFVKRNKLINLFSSNTGH
ncbi:MAG: multicopper oxidase domain-containing protein [Methylococcales bacterium]|nr:multicopper oxidase domain-containing protein [Methylococcales bacterium]